MTQDYEYALLSGSAYVSQRHQDNRMPTPMGWDPAPNGHAFDLSSGFEAVAYKKGNEVVIAYAGTDQGIDWLTNIAAAASPSKAAKGVRDINFLTA
jgi:hypothetical protein